MRNKNLVSGVKRQNNYGVASNNQEGIFKTTRGMFVVRVLQGNKTVIKGQYKTEEEAKESYEKNYSK